MLSSKLLYSAANGLGYEAFVKAFCVEPTIYSHSRNGLTNTVASDSHAMHSFCMHVVIHVCLERCFLEATFCPAAEVPST